MSIVAAAMGLMLLLVEHVVMKKSLVLKSVFIRLGINITVGILKINDLSYGVHTMAQSIKEKAFAYFHYQIGQS